MPHFWKYVMSLLLLSHFSHVRFCATPSLGFSRQEHWSGLPFPSPMHESKKWKWSHSVMSNSSPWTAAYQAPPSMGFFRQDYWSGVPLPSPMLYYYHDVKSIVYTVLKSYLDLYHYIGWKFLTILLGFKGVIILLRQK